LVTIRSEIYNACIGYVHKCPLFLSDPIAYSEASIRNNAAILDYCRTSMSALSGSTAGILGLTGLYGFAFYFITAFILSVCWQFPLFDN